MIENVKSVFEDECKNLLIDVKLVKKLVEYYQLFVNKNEDHIRFFGGNLLGVQIVRFTDADRNRWFDEIMEVVDGPLEERLLALPNINAEFHVSSDTMNLSCAWLAHAISISPKLNDAQKHEGMVHVFLILQIRFFTSRYFRHFRYPADKAVAEATYAQLSYKYAIKVYGSWAALFLARSEEIISHTSIHYKTIVELKDDLRIVYMLNDIQGRIRDMLKNIYDVFINTHKQGIKISSTSLVIAHDGEEILKDKTKNLAAYGRYLCSIVTDRNSFMREELMAIIEKLMHTTPPRLFRETLEWMSHNYRQSNAGDIELALNEIIIHSFDYLSQNRALVRNTLDLPELLSKLRGVYTSSRSSDPVLLSIREHVEHIVQQATNNKNNSIIASVRTSVCLYVVLRAFTMKHYSQ